MKEMNTNDVENDILLMGLPSTGKSTYLAALWHVINSDKNEKSLNLLSLGGDNKYLNFLRNYWLSCDTVPRNKIDQSEGKEVKLLIETTNSHIKTLLSVPDFSGETFRFFWEDRKWSDEMQELINNANGLLFFISPIDIKPHASISESIPIEELLDDESIIDGEVELKNSIENWEMQFTPTQVILVELLQYLVYYSTLEKPIKLGVIVSAWDMVKNVDGIAEPKSWLSKELPLLFQYLKSNPELYNFKVFGVSAQGGEYNVEDKLNNPLLEYDDPTDRIKVQVGNEVFSDIGVPICWLIE